MGLIRCNKGHFYDEYQFRDCPHCNNPKVRDDKETMALTQGDSNASVTVALTEEVSSTPVNFPDALDVPKTPSQPTNTTLQEVMKNTPSNNVAKTMPEISNLDDKNKTVYFHEESGKDPVVGWLVCIEGNHFGDDFKLKMGRNFIGRSSHMDICLSSDDSVSREKHAIVLYEPRQHIFLVQPGESKGLCYLNDEVVLQAMEIKARDVLAIGETKLIFTPFCSKDLNWDVIKKRNEED